MQVKAHFAAAMLHSSRAALSWLAFQGPCDEPGNSAGDVLFEETRVIDCSQLVLAEYQAFGYCLNSLLNTVKPIKQDKPKQVIQTEIGEIKSLPGDGAISRLDVFGSTLQMIAEVNGIWMVRPETERYRDRCRELMLNIAITLANRWDYPRIAYISPEENRLALDLLEG